MSVEAGPRRGDSVVAHPYDRVEPALLDHQAGLCIRVTDDPVTDAGAVPSVPDRRYEVLEAGVEVVEVVETGAAGDACLVPEPCNADRDVRLCARCAQDHGLTCRERSDAGDARHRLAHGDQATFHSAIADATGERIEIAARRCITDQRLSAADGYRRAGPSYSQDLRAATRGTTSRRRLPRSPGSDDLARCRRPWRGDNLAASASSAM